MADLPEDKKIILTTLSRVFPLTHISISIISSTSEILCYISYIQLAMLMSIVPVLFPRFSISRAAGS